ncbi:MAG TPA: phage portal protein, partial [Clostridiales bacterium]|nr:phage portal protein [Clostridiales bacterium]
MIKTETRVMFGREVIYSSVTEVTRANVVDVLEKAMNIHKKNSNEIDYLYQYYKGNQPILQRVKTIRPEINNKVVENHALEIVDFKKGYVFGEPVQYVRRGESDGVSEKITQLNEFMFAEDKAARDKEL